MRVEVGVEVGVGVGVKLAVRPGLGGTWSFVIGHRYRELLDNWTISISTLTLVLTG